MSVEDQGACDRLVTTPTSELPDERPSYLPRWPSWLGNCATVFSFSSALCEAEAAYAVWRLVNAERILQLALGHL